MTQYSYDNLNRLVEAVHLVDNSVETNVYTDYGELKQATNADVAYTYAYNAKHQLIGKADGRSGKALGWGYDKAGNIAAKVDYQGDLTTYQYDSTNRLVAETNAAYLEASYHYDPAGRLLDRILSNGAQAHYGWDAAGRLAKLINTTAAIGGVVNNTRYTRDRVGNVLAQTEFNSDSQLAGVTTYTYDPGYRPLTADYPARRWTRPSKP